MKQTRDTDMSRHEYLTEHTVISADIQPVGHKNEIITNRLCRIIYKTYCTINVCFDAFIVLLHKKKTLVHPKCL